MERSCHCLTHKTPDRPAFPGNSASDLDRRLARAVRAHGAPFKPPVALLSGGECTVTVRGTNGRGGRCGEFLLVLGLELAGTAEVHAIAADTDGIDGSEDNAGALLAPDTLARASAQGLYARKFLAANDSYGNFQRLATWWSPDPHAPTSTTSARY